MKKNLLDAEASESIIKRVEKFSVGCNAIWGEMNATEMLLHCNSCNRQILEEGRKGKTGMGQFLLRYWRFILPLVLKKD